jgi:hypothetical protein
MGGVKSITILLKQMNVNGKGKHVSIINKANKVEEKF